MIKSIGQEADLKMNIKVVKNMEDLENAILEAEKEARQIIRESKDKEKTDSEESEDKGRKLKFEKLVWIKSCLSYL